MTLKVHAGRLAAEIPDGVRQALALDPVDALRREFAIDVVPVDELRRSRGDGGWCDGVSLTTGRVICYAPTPGSRRQNFTLLHELGHILVNEDNEAIDWLADRPNPSSDLERLCDAIAADVLLPASTIASVLANDAPSPGHLRQLYASSRASEEVCAIALAARLPARGAVVLIQRRTATVTFASSSGWPPLSIPRGLAVPARHPLRDLGVRQQWNGWTTSDLRIAFAERPSTDIAPHPLFRTQAEAGPRRTTALMLLDNAGANRMTDDHTLRTMRLDLGTSDVPNRICHVCGQDAASNNYPCEECGVPPCPACGRCRCV